MKFRLQEGQTNFAEEGVGGGGRIRTIRCVIVCGITVAWGLGKQGPQHAVLQVHTQDHTSRQVFKFLEVGKLMLSQKTNMQGHLTHL